MKSQHYILQCVDNITCVERLDKTVEKMKHSAKDTSLYSLMYSHIAEYSATTS